ncbi:hypothetical protein P3T76_007188 [Phytophthora citrophthora]|uniref:J domain-containing protein n=1 Tax=Phytophthora citrophthora TaxID=4793 RepID=A0AAD9GMS4_9STRA|nr:hypothetical protein P3T76_007188 [Phytophthora citrophthora]
MGFVAIAGGTFLFACTSVAVQAVTGGFTQRSVVGIGDTLELTDIFMQLAKVTVLSFATVVVVSWFFQGYYLRKSILENSKKRQLAAPTKRELTAELTDSDDNTETSSDCGTVIEESEHADLFDWQQPLLTAMKKSVPTKSTSLLFRLGGTLDRWLQVKDDDEPFQFKELIQFVNPVIQPILRNIKRTGLQPPMTSDDKDRLLRYKIKAQRVLDETVSANDGVFLFKLTVADEQAIDFETKYRLSYASVPISYDQVIAITYAWHESEKKSDIKLDGITIQLGKEWDVEAVLDSLVELSKDKWIWMDQFSLIQKTMTTSTLSYNIPKIYRNVRVVAFLPYKICDRLNSHITKFRESKDPDVSAVLAEVMLHDLVCECTDGIYGWLSRLWTWQELMLATSLRFVWGLGVSRWTRREVFNEEVNDQEEIPEEESSFSRLWTKTKKIGTAIKKTVKHSLTDLSVSEQPITKLLNELTQRNIESVIIPVSESATLSMAHYFCVRLLCGAEIHMPRASRTPPINCLKVLQQIASTGRKGGRVYDCYYAAAAFIDDTSFLPQKKKSMAAQNQQGKGDDLKDETALRQAYIELYERENVRRPSAYVLADPKALLEAYTKLYENRHNRNPDVSGKSHAELRQAYTELYNNVHNTFLVKYTGAPVPNDNCFKSTEKDEDPLDHFHPIAWEKNTQSRRNLQKLTSLSEQFKQKHSILASLVQADIQGGFLNAFVLSGMTEEAFCETQGEYFCGTAYDIISINRIKVGRKQDFWINSVYKIAANLHPSQLHRVRNFNTIPADMRLALFPLAHAIIHATRFKVHAFPAHFVKVFSALLGARTASSYVDAVTMLLGESFDSIADENGEHENQFRLAKITFSDGTCCVGVVSKRLKELVKETIVESVAESAIGKFVASTLLSPGASAMAASAVKVVKSHNRLLLCGGVLSDWSIVGYIPGLDAGANVAMLGPISHANVQIKKISA